MSGGPVVHVIDDDSGVRRSLHMLLDSAALPVHSYESAEQFLETADLASPACVVLDLRMPGMGGLKLLEQLKDLNCIWPVIVISGHADVDKAVRCIKLGAIDLLQKPFEPQALVEAVRRASENLYDAHHRRLERDLLRQKIDTLTPREHDLLERIVAGKSNKQIAIELGISIKTVANHRASVMIKIGAVNAPDLVRISMIAGL